MYLYTIRQREVVDRYIQIKAEHQGLAIGQAIQKLRESGVEAKAGEMSVEETLIDDSPMEGENEDE
jgi:hypothetical protein